MTQNPKVASSLGMNLSGARAFVSTSARATSIENTYLQGEPNYVDLVLSGLEGTRLSSLPEG